MEGLRWWLLLLTAIMFSMAGCAMQDWSTWSTTHAHFVSVRHSTFSVPGHPAEATISEDDMVVAAREEWWDRPLPDGDGGPSAPGDPDTLPAALPAMDMTGT